MGLMRPPASAGGVSRAGRSAAAIADAVASSIQRSRGGLSVADRRTLAMGGLAAATTVAVAVTEVGRVWRRVSAPAPNPGTDLLQAAEEAVTETVEAAVVGYQEVSS